MCIYICMHVCIYICIYIYIKLYIYMWTYIAMDIYIYTYPHIHPYRQATPPPPARSWWSFCELDDGIPLWAFSRLAGPGVCERVSLWDHSHPFEDTLCRFCRDPLYRGTWCDPKGSMAFLQNNFRCPPMSGARRTSKA